MIEIDVHNKDTIKTALRVIGKGGVIIYPTDTLYGFGVDAANDNAIEKLNNIKGRSGPLSVLAPDETTALSWANISLNEAEIIRPHLSGYSTMIYKVVNNIVSHKILGNDHSLGVRMPHHTFCNELSKLYPHPITTTSVNRHGGTALNDPKSILKEFRAEIDLFINSGRFIGNKGSSIYQLDHGNLIQLRS